MPFIPVPGTAEVQINGTIGTNPWQVKLHFQGNPPQAVWTSTQLAALNSAFVAGPWTTLAANWPSLTQMDALQAIDLSTTTPASAAEGFQVIGVASEQQDAAACLMFNYLIAARYRGGKPRTYLPGLAPTAQASPNSWSASVISTIASEWQTAITNMKGAAAADGQAGCQQVCIQYNYLIQNDTVHHKYIRTRQSFKQTLPISGTIAHQTIRTQRRRLTSTAA